MTATSRDIPVLAEDISLIDTHCHLDMADFASDLPDVLKRAAQHGVRHTVTIGIDLQSSEQAIELARRQPAVSATIGIHPHDAVSASARVYEDLAVLAERHHDVVVGYGEIGLDYVKQYAPPARQRQVFREQLAIARNLHLPIVVHNREADEDTLRILKTEGVPNGGVMHCFSGDLQLAMQVIELGMHISIPGVVTFKNAHTMQQVAATIPLESLVVETDGPFLAPHPFRGKRNEPLYTLFTAAHIAGLRKLELAEVARETTRNAMRLFHLPAVHH